MIVEDANIIPDSKRMFLLKYRNAYFLLTEVERYGKGGNPTEYNEVVKLFDSYSGERGVAIPVKRKDFSINPDAEFIAEGAITLHYEGGEEA